MFHLCYAFMLKTLTCKKNFENFKFLEMREMLREHK